MKNFGIGRLASTVLLGVLLASCGTNPAVGDAQDGNMTPKVSITARTESGLRAQGATGANAFFEVRVADDGTVKTIEYSLDDGPVTTSEVSATLLFSVQGLSGGSHALKVFATDDRGATGAATLTFNVDAVAPTLSGVTFNGAALGDGQSLTMTQGGTATFAASSTDAGGGSVSLTLYRGNTAISTDTGSAASVAYDLTDQPLGTQMYRLVATDAVGNSTVRQFSLTVNAAVAPVLVPSPQLLLSSELSVYSGSISVQVTGGFPAGLEIDSVVLQVTDKNGFVDAQTYTSTQNFSTFLLDTTDYPDGQLRLKVIARARNGVTAESAERIISIQNLVPPRFSIDSPTSGESIGNTLEAQVQLIRQNTDFTYPDGRVVTFNVLDYRGAVVKSAQAAITTSDPSLDTARVTFDMSADVTPNNIYTLETVTKVLLSGESTPRTLTEYVQFTTQTTNSKPPALIIQLPSYTNHYLVGSDTPTTPWYPTITRRSGVLVQISDDNNISEVQVQLVCDADPACANSGSYGYNIPVQASGLVYRVFPIGQLLDAQPYVPDARYVLRFTVSDGENTNMQEIKVRVARRETLVYSPVSAVDAMTTPNNFSQQPNPSSAAWGLGSFSKPTIDPTSTTETYSNQFTPSSTTNPVRVLQVFYGTGAVLNSVPSAVAISPEVSGSATLLTTYGFTEPGTYRNDYMIQDLNTGIVEWFAGPQVTVIKNP